jgi:NADPH-dependent ferric siderophore reductase
MRATVARTTQLTPHMMRVTVTGEELARFRWPGPAGHLKVMLPDPATGDLTLPEPDADGMVAFDRRTALTMRTYTARRFDPTTLELDLDVVLHGDGPAATWASQTRPGDSLAVSSPRRPGFEQDPDADWILVAGDASALPAIATIATVVTKPTTFLIEIDDPKDTMALDAEAAWIARDGASGDALEQAVLGWDRPAGRGQVWVAAEAQVIRRIRTGLLRQLDREQVTTRGYWRAGESNHPDHDYGE